MRFLMMLLGFAGTGAALAGTSSTSAQPAYAGMWVMLGLVYLTRRRPIGGWLFYFYLQLYFSAVIVTLLTATQVANFDMSKWSDAKLYVWYVLSTVPQLAVQAWVVVSAAVLQARRTAKNLERVRMVTALYAAVVAVGMVIDVAYFKETATLMMDGFTLTFAIIWAMYFRRSRRVEAVFVHHNWSYAAAEAAKPPALTREELRYVHKRALWFGGVTFVGLLILMGETWKGPPEASMLILPFAYGLVAAGFGRYLPVSRSKRLRIGQAAALSGAKPAETPAGRA